MRTTIERVATLAVAGLLFALAPRGDAEAQDAPTLDGSWTARAEGGEWGWVHLKMGERGWGTTLPEADAEALAASAGAAGEVGLVLDRPAGRVEIEGMMSGDRGRGVFRFRADAGFARQVRALGFDPEPRELLSAAIHDVRVSSIGELRRAGLEPDDFGQLVGAAVFDVDTTWVAELRALGVDGDLDDFIAFRIHGVTPDFVRGVRSWNVGPVDPQDLLAFRIHGVSEEFVRSLQQERLEGLTADRLVAFRIHGVSADFARAVRAWELGEADGDDLVALRIHRVAPEFVQAMRDAGVPPDDLQQAIAFRIHGVTPELVRELRDAGFEDLDGDDLIKVRIHGFDRMLRRRGGGGGGS